MPATIGFSAKINRYCDPTTAELVRDGGREQPELDQERHRVADVAVADVER